jgi:histone H3/H4
MDEEIMLIKDSTTRKFLKDSGLQITPAFLEALNNKIKILLLDAILRAKFNRRKTLMSQDV